MGAVAADFLAAVGAGEACFSKCWSLFGCKRTFKVRISVACDLPESNTAGRWLVEIAKHSCMNATRALPTLHIFCCGSINRRLSREGDSIYMSTTGYGYNVLPGTSIRSEIMANLNSSKGRQIFKALDQQLIKYIKEAKNEF